MNSPSTPPPSATAAGATIPVTPPTAASTGATPSATPSASVGSATPAATALPDQESTTTNLFRQLLQNIQETRAEIATLRADSTRRNEEMLKENAKRDKEMIKETSKTREDFAKLEMRIADREKNMTRWIVASFVATIVVISGILSIFQFGFPS